MKDRLSRIWKLQAGFEIMDIGHGFYMAKFDIAADRIKVMEEGPCMIFDYYLTVQTWTPDFMSSSAKIDKTMVWVRFPSLNLLYYDESILMTLASTIGKPIKVDSNTLDVRRGRFARVCVEIDLTKPVIGKVGLQGFWYNVEYEGLHRLCTKCGCYGHLTRECTVVDLSTTHEKGNKEEDGAINPDSSTQSLDQNKSITDCVKTVTDSAKIKEPIYGDWMVVKKKQHKKRPTKSNNNGTNVKGKSIMGNHGRREKQVNDSAHLSHAAPSRNVNKDPQPSKVFSTKPNNKRHRSEIGGSSKLGQSSKLGARFSKSNAPNSISFHLPNSVAKTEPNRDKPKLDKSSAGKPNNNSEHREPIIYDVGHGAKSTVFMEALTPNRFILLEDVNDDTSQDNLHDDKMEESNHDASHGNKVHVPGPNLMNPWPCSVFAMSNYYFHYCLLWIVSIISQFWLGLFGVLLVKAPNVMFVSWFVCTIPPFFVYSKHMGCL